jgi:hypothetical protein
MIVQEGIGIIAMALTRDFKETIQARVARDPAFREALLKEGVECLLSGDVETGKTVCSESRLVRWSHIVGQFGGLVKV